MKKFVFLFLIFFLFSFLVRAEVTSTTDPIGKIDNELVKKYFPKPADWGSMTVEQQRNLRQNQMTYLMTQVISQLEKKGTGTVSIKEGTVEYFGPAHKAILANQAQEAGFAKQEALALVAKSLSEKTKLKGRGPEALANFYASLDKKREETRKKLAEKPELTVDWNSPQAQSVIKAWVEANMLGGKKLEDVMGKDAKGKVNADAVALLNATYISKDQVDKIDIRLVANETKASELSTSIIKNTLDIGQLQQTFSWVTATGSDGTTYQVPKSLQPDMLPLDVLSIKTDLATKADKIDLDKKADKTEIQSEIKRVETKVNTVRDATAANALGKKDRALVYIYLSYKQEGNIAGFRCWLESQGKANLFNKIEKNAKDREQQLEQAKKTTKK